MPKPTPLPSQETLHRLLKYDPETGTLFWKVREDGSLPKKFIDRPALNGIKQCGYRYGVLLGKAASAHRVIYKMMTGKEPPEIDHRDGDSTNNRWPNLRASNRTQNQRNRKKPHNSRAKRCGVHLRRKGGWSGYVARITVNWSEIYLGTFPANAEGFTAGCAARLAAERKHGFSNRHGKKGGP